jgi:hypothetical protein
LPITVKILETWKYAPFYPKYSGGAKNPKRAFPVQETDEELQRGFKLRYLQFKRILNANDKVLNMMAEMEEALQGNKPFGMSFVRSRCTLISANVYQIIQHLNALAHDGPYQALYERFKDIQQKVGSLLDARPRDHRGESWFWTSARSTKPWWSLPVSKWPLGEIANTPGGHPARICDYRSRLPSVHDPQPAPGGNRSAHSDP